MLLSLTLTEHKNALVNINFCKNWSIKRIIPHLLFWLFYVLFFGLFYGKYGHDYRLHLIETSCMMPFVMLATYCTIYGILPFYLREHKLVPTLLLVGPLLFVVTLGERVFLRKLNGLPISSDTLLGVTFLYLMLETNFIVGLGFTVKFVKKWLEQQPEKHDIEKKQLETELNLLIGQLHPHYLFNTMNNLYALSVEKSSLTSEGIAKISDLLRSVLYECNELEISLDKEINLIENYIDLEKMRYGNRLKIKFSVNGKVDETKIAPMLLFTFVENCFKHGSSNDPGTPFININIEVNNKSLLFKAENSTPRKKIEQAENHIGGIGLANVKKRLELIYRDKYKLSSEYKNYCYEVKLEIRK